MAGGDRGLRRRGRCLEHRCIRERHIYRKRGGAFGRKADRRACSAVGAGRRERIDQQSQEPVHHLEAGLLGAGMVLARELGQRTYKLRPRQAEKVYDLVGNVRSASIAASIAPPTWATLVGY